MIIYAAFEIQMSGLKLGTMEQVETLRQKLLEAARALHQERDFDSDVEVELIESAGEETHV